MEKRRLLAAFAAGLAILLSGCMSMSPDDLYKLPKMPGDYYKLHERIESIRELGGQLVSPTAGFNRQALQMIDLNGDSVQEAVAHFRFESEKPMKIYIFKNDGEQYTQAGLIEQDAQGIDSVYYEDLTGDGILEIIVGWQAEQGALRAISAYRVGEANPVEIGNSDYSEYTVYDIDENGVNDLLLVQYDSASKTGRVKQLSFSIGEQLMEVVSEAALSREIGNISRVRTGTLMSGERALYVASMYGTSEIVTDVIAVRDRQLTNISANAEKGVSETTARQSAIYAADIMGSGYLSIPQLIKLPKHNNEPSAEDFWKINWMSYNLDGTVSKVVATYHNFTNGWYLLLPEELEKNMSMYRVTDFNGDKTTYFSWYDLSKGRSTDLLKIKTVAAGNIEEAKKSAIPDNQILLYDGADMLVIAEPLVPEGDYDKYLFTREEVINSFRIIQKEWLAAE